VDTSKTEISSPLPDGFSSQTSGSHDYYAHWLWAETDRHRLITLEWIATKRAMRAEAEVKKLKQQIEDMRNAPELLFPR
jgi:hypothetical protein